MVRRGTMTRLQRIGPRDPPRHGRDVILMRIVRGLLQDMAGRFSLARTQTIRTAFGVTATLALAFGGLLASVDMAQAYNTVPTSERAEDVRSRVRPMLRAQLAAADLSYGAPVFIRVFKLSRQLELWVQGDEGPFKLFRTYSICAYSGGLGPKQRQGDRQSPEGFYTVTGDNLNPNSQFHLSFNLGFPNAYDRAHGRTGSLLMIHGSCVSEGCFAMTDRHMEEIYTLTAAAIDQGQDGVPVHIFPFRMTDTNIKATRRVQYHDFWMNLKSGHDLFEQTLVPPAVWVNGVSYAFLKRKPDGALASQGGDQFDPSIAGPVPTGARRPRIDLASYRDGRGASEDGVAILTSEPQEANYTDETSVDRLLLSEEAEGAAGLDGDPTGAGTEEPAVDEDGVPCGWPNCPLPTVQ